MCFQRRDAENAEEAQRTLSRMEGGGGSEAFDLTRRRGGAEKKVERRSGIRAFRVRFAEGAENAVVRSPSFARMDKAEPYPTG
jgi:hypothetical protein